MLHVCYYITGHGLGHATRSIGLIQHMIHIGLHVTIITSLASEFFYSNIQLSNQSNSHSFHVIQRTLDSGAIQIDPLTIDILATLKAYYRIHTYRHDIIQTEINFLSNNHFNIILTDATSIVCHIARLINIPSVIISNFTWDFIYLELLQHVRITLDSNLLNEYEQMIETCTLDVYEASLYIRLPVTVPLVARKISGKNVKGNDMQVIDAPMLCRRAITDKTEMRRILGIQEGTNVLLIGFGGHKSGRSMPMIDSSLPLHWIAFVLGMQEEDNMLTSSRFKPLPSDIYVPDYINLADVVLGKIGYGTVTECLAHGTPLIYVPRLHWPEEKYGVTYISSLHAGVQMESEDFYSGNWMSAIEEAFALANGWDFGALGAEESIARVAELVMSVATSKSEL